MHTSQSQISFVGFPTMSQGYYMIHCMADGNITLINATILTMTGGALKNEFAQRGGNIDSSHGSSRNSFVMAEIRFQHDEHVINISEDIQFIVFLLG